MNHLRQFQTVQYQGQPETISVFRLTNSDLLGTVGKSMEHGPSWTTLRLLVHRGPLWTIMDKGPSMTSSDHLHHLATNRDRRGPLRTRDHLEGSKTTTTVLAFSTHLRSPGTARVHQGPPKSIQDHHNGPDLRDPLLVIRDRQGPSGGLGE